MSSRSEVLVQVLCSREKVLRTKVHDFEIRAESLRTETKVLRLFSESEQKFYFKKIRTISLEEYQKTCSELQQVRTFLLKLGVRYYDL